MFRGHDLRPCSSCDLFHPEGNEDQAPEDSVREHEVRAFDRLDAEAGSARASKRALLPSLEESTVRSKLRKEASRRFVSPEAVCWIVIF